MLEHWQSFYQRLKDKFSLEEIKSKYKRLLVEFQERLILLSQMPPSAGPGGDEFPINLPVTGNLYYYPSINTLNWFTGNNYSGISYRNVTLNNFNLGVDPNTVRSLSFNTSSGNINQIETIDHLDLYTNLNSLDIHNQALSDLNVSGSFALAKLDCSENDLTSLDVTQNSLLYYLDCQVNLLQSLDVSNNNLLQHLNISYNSFYNIDLTSNSNLQEFYCAVNNISTSLDLSGNNQLLKLDCRYNEIPSLNLSQTPNLKELYCQHNSITQSLNFNLVDSLEIVECNKNRLGNINFIGNNSSLTRLVCGDQFNLLQTVNMGNKPNLTYLSCTNNPNLNQLDITSCPALEELYLSSNPLLPGVDITYSTNLKTLVYASANLTGSSIDFTNQTKLEDLQISNNVLGGINLSDCSKLHNLEAFNSGLYSVVLSSTNTSTENTFTFNFNNNHLTSSQVNNILQTLNNYDNVSGTRTLDLSGGTNEGPSGAGVTYLNSLITKGWSITTTTPYPSITSFSPGSGNIGSSVIITGAYFTGTTSVKFNGISATSFTVNSSTQITATVPVGATTGKITITTPSGHVTSATNYSVNVQAPVVTSFSPSAGLVGSVVTISGDYFNGTTDVTFFNNKSSLFKVVSNTTITASVPAAVTTGPISVTTPNGTGISATNFDPVLAPSISNFTPASGFVGTLVEITGSEFTTVSSVRFNNVTSSYTLVNDTGIKATVPSSATTGDITVITSGGTATSPSTFTVTVPAPTITSFSPGTGSVATSVTITGTNFTGVTSVQFRNITSSFYTVPSNTQIIAAVPIGFNKSGPIGVTTPGGLASSSLDFIYSAPSARLGYTPITSLVNWYTAENYAGTLNENVTLSDFQNNVTPTAVYTLEFPDSSNITNISNLSTYTNLKTLDVTFQNLTSLNLTGNGTIKQLYCDNNDLTSLDLSNNNVITILSCDDNLLTSLNVNNMTSLSSLSFISCALPSISLTTNTGLRYLEANNNQLSSINLSNNTLLITADLSENLLTSITTTNNTALQILNIGTNSISGAINLSTNTALTDLNCESNTITSITGLSSLTNLAKLTISNNAFSSLNISANSNLVEIYAAVNGMTSVTLPNAAGITITTTYHLDLSSNNLDASAINYVLQTVDTYTTPSGGNMTDKYIDLSGGSNAVPTGAGLTALTSLRAKGYTILTN